MRLKLLKVFFTKSWCHSEFFCKELYLTKNRFFEYLYFPKKIRGLLIKLIIFVLTLFV